MKFDPALQPSSVTLTPLSRHRPKHENDMRELIAAGVLVNNVFKDEYGRTGLDMEGSSSDFSDFALETYRCRLSDEEGKLAFYAILRSLRYEEGSTHGQPSRRWIRFHLPIGHVTARQFTELLRSFPRDIAETRDSDGSLPIHIACRRGALLEVIRILHGRNGLLLRTANNHGSLPLHAALANCLPCWKSIQYLVEQGGVETCAVANNEGILPLHIICREYPNWDIIRFLVTTYPLALTRRNRAGNLPLFLANQCDIPCTTKATTRHGFAVHTDRKLQDISAIDVIV